MDRRIIRENIMQFVYQMDVTENQATDTLNAIRDHISEIDKLISKNIDNWDINRLPKADLAILRTALAEILYVDSIPANVSINEAVELGKIYGDERSYAFINSVLGKINRELNEQ